MLLSISGIILRLITAQQNLIFTYMPDMSSFQSKVFHFYYLAFCLKQ